MKRGVLTYVLLLLLATAPVMAAEKVPSAAEIRHDLRWAEHYISKGDYLKAEELLNSIFNNNWETKGAGRLLITMYRAQRRKFEERAVWGALKAANPGDADYFKGYFEALLKTGDVKRATLLLDDARLSRRPEISALREQLTRYQRGSQEPLEVSTTVPVAPVIQPTSYETITVEQAVAPPAPVSQRTSAPPVTISEALLTVHFPTLSTELNEYEQEKLERLVRVMPELRTGTIKITGYSDNLKIARRSRGKYPNNRMLSLSRAKSVGRYLTDKLNFSSAKLFLYGKGESSPVAENGTKAGRALNRRVVLSPSLLSATAERAFTRYGQPSKNAKPGMSPDSTDTLRQAELLIEQGDYAQAEELLDPLFNHDIDMRGAAPLLIKSYQAQGRLLEEQAVRSVLKAAYPADLGYRKEYIKSLLRSGDYERAAALLDDSRIRHNQEFTPLREELARNYVTKAQPVATTNNDAAPVRLVVPILPPVALTAPVTPAAPSAPVELKGHAKAVPETAPAPPVAPPVIQTTPAPTVPEQPVLPTASAVAPPVAETPSPSAPVVAAAVPVLPVVEPEITYERGAFALQVNGEKYGEHFVLLKDSDVLVEKQLLDDSGFTAAGKEVTVDGTVYTSLASRAPGVTYKVDDRAFQLNLTVEVGQFKQQLLNMRGEEPKVMLKPNNPSAFINYSFELLHDTRLDREGISIPHEMGIRYKDYLLFSSYGFNKPVSALEQEHYVRLYTNLTKDDRDAMMRYTLGDFNSYSNSLGGGAILGGISVTRNFGMNPFYIRTGGFSVSGAVENSSEVEVYRNGSLLTKRSIAPGFFDLQNMPLLDGTGDVTLVIKDAFGRERRIDMPYTVSQELLRKGVHDFGYYAGFERRDIGTASSSYGNSAALFHHRLGITNTITAGLSGELARDARNIGISGTTTIPWVGTIGGTAATSWSERDDVDGTWHGSAYRLGLTNGFPLAGLFYNVSYGHITPEYATVSMKPFTSRSLTDLSGSVGIGGNQWGSVTLYGSLREVSLMQGEQATVGVRYSFPIFKSVNLMANVSKTEANSRTDWAGSLTLTSFLGSAGSASIAAQRNSNINSLTASLQKSPENEQGFGYRATMRSVENQKDTADAELTWNGRHGIYGASYQTLADRAVYGIKTSGSIATLFDDIHFSRPIYDSFSVIKVDHLKGVPVYQGGREVGTTNSNGEVFAPSVTSYADNPFMVRQQDLPFNYSAPELKKSLSPNWRSGTRLIFDVDKMQAIRGTVTIVDGAEQKAADYWVLTIKANGKNEVAPLVKDGEFYLENIPAGSHQATVAKEKNLCTFSITIPANDEPMIDLGILTCTMHKKEGVTP